METLVPLFIHFASGAVGGIVAGVIFKNISLGPIGNALAGLVGGGVAGQMFDIASRIGLDGMIGDVVIGGVGGGGIMVAIGLAKKFMPE